MTHTSMSHALVLAATIGAWPIWTGCSSDESAGQPDAGTPDAGPLDAGPLDAGSADGADSGLDATTGLIMCPEGEFAVGFEADGTLRCDTIDVSAFAAFNEDCTLYFGNSNNPSDPGGVPDKWGRVSEGNCVDGSGGNFCSIPGGVSLGGSDVTLFGLQPAGDVNDNDRLYIGFDCVAPLDNPVGSIEEDGAHVCPPGTYISARTGTTAQCITARASIASHLDDSCRVYLGQRDNCQSCDEKPTEWGWVSGKTCYDGAGADNHCQPAETFSLGGSEVILFGLNPTGDVDGNDMFYMGFQCTAAAPVESTNPGTCPEGQLVVGIDSTIVHCAGPLVEAHSVIHEHCSFYLGWQDGGVAGTLEKWARVWAEGCDPGEGGFCPTNPILLDSNVNLLQVNTDGDVDGNDWFYVGLQCSE